MASVKTLEREIRALEGFEVALRADGPARRSYPAYDYGRAARAAFTVDDWKRARFEPNYPDVEVDLLRADGRVAKPAMTLVRLRAEYDDRT